MFVLGIIAGLLIAVLVIVTTFMYKKPVEKSIKKLQTMYTEKGGVFAPPDSEVSSWVDSLPEH